MSIAERFPKDDLFSHASAPSGARRGILPPGPPRHCAREFAAQDSRDSGSVAAVRQPGLISGRVVDAITERPLRAAIIRVIGQDALSQAGDAARFTLSGVRPGIVQLEVRRLGYVPLIKGDVAVSAGKPVVVKIALARLQVQLQAVAVRPSAFPAQPPAATPVSSTTLSSEELRRTPGAGEDVVQALSIAPGVATTTAGRNDLFVRRGAAYENLFVVDNIEVPNINHFGTQGNTGGPISLLNIRFIDNATSAAGGFGVRYGDRLSSATSLTLRDGNRERISGEVNLAASQYGAIIEGPIGSTGSFFLNARRSYLDLLFKALGQSFIPSYSDAMVKATWRPGTRDVISLLTIGAIDRVTFSSDNADQRVENARVLAPSQDQYFSGLTWKRLFANGVVTSTLGRTYTHYNTAQFDSLSPPNPIFEANTTEGESSLRSDLSWQVTPRLAIDAGNIAKYADRLRYDVTIPGLLRVDAGGNRRPLRVDTAFSDFRNATYAQATLQATPQLRLTAGVRSDYYDFVDHGWVLAPRGSAPVQLDDVTSLTLSERRYYQPPPFLWAECALGIQWTPEGVERGSCDAVFRQWRSGGHARLRALQHRATSGVLLGRCARRPTVARARYAARDLHRHSEHQRARERDRVAVASARDAGRAAAGIRALPTIGVNWEF